MRKLFTEGAWNDFIFWTIEDKKIVKKINSLLDDVERNKYTGLGHPEPLKNDFSGYWSRRINEEHRLIYRIIENEIIEIYQCKGHYDDK